MDVEEDELQALYTWVDEIPLSRPKRNIARDFADGEVVHNFHPKLVDLHNYSAAHGLAQKLYNWNTLNQKVFRKMGFLVAKSEYEAVANCIPGAVERILKLVKNRVARHHDAAETTAMSVQDTLDGVGPMAYPEGGRAGSHGAAMCAPEAVVHVTVGGGEHSFSRKADKAGIGDLEQTVAELREMCEILEVKAQKLEQLVRLKDAKIQTLMAKLQQAGLL